MTLIELSVVLIALLALAGLVVPYINSSSDLAACRIADANLTAVRDAIMGGGGGPGFYGDLGGVPARPDNNGRPTTDYDLNYLFRNYSKTDADCPSSDTALCDQFRSFNPTTGRGWHGPYLQSGFTVVASRVNSTSPLGDLYTRHFTDSACNAEATNCFVNAPLQNGDNFVGDGYLLYPDDGYLAPTPIVLQVPIKGNICGTTTAVANPAGYARLVSAGPNGVLETALGDAHACNRGDDRVLFLRMPDPGKNQSCTNG